MVLFLRFSLKSHIVLKFNALVFENNVKVYLTLTLPDKYLVKLWFIVVSFSRIAQIDVGGELWLSRLFFCKNIKIILCVKILGKGTQFIQLLRYSHFSERMYKFVELETKVTHAVLLPSWNRGTKTFLKVRYGDSHEKI